MTTIVIPTTEIHKAARRLAAKDILLDGPTLTRAAQEGFDAGYIFAYNSAAEAYATKQEAKTAKAVEQFKAKTELNIEQAIAGTEEALTVRFGSAIAKLGATIKTLSLTLSSGNSPDPEVAMRYFKCGIEMQRATTELLKVTMLCNSKGHEAVVAELNKLKIEGAK